MRKKLRFMGLIDVRVPAQRALALAHAAIEQPSATRVREAKRQLSAVLSTLAPWQMSDAVDLARSVRRVLDTLTVVERRIAFS
jgi:hypothetical protein